MKGKKKGRGRGTKEEKWSIGFPLGLTNFHPLTIHFLDPRNGPRNWSEGNFFERWPENKRFFLFPAFNLTPVNDTRIVF